MRPRTRTDSWGELKLAGTRDMSINPSMYVADKSPGINPPGFTTNSTADRLILLIPLPEALVYTPKSLQTMVV